MPVNPAEPLTTVAQPLEPAADTRPRGRWLNSTMSSGNYDACVELAFRRGHTTKTRPVDLEGSTHGSMEGSEVNASAG